MSRKAKAQLASAVETEETKIEKFGQQLFDLHRKTVSPSIFELQLRYYGDYLHHFGFSIEKETKNLRESFPLLAPHDTTISHDSVVSDAGWGIDEVDRNEADTWVQKIGPLEGVTKLEELASQIVSPYQRITWRHSITQCSMRKARALYVWLCTNVRVEIPPPAQEETTVTPTMAAVAVKTKKGDRQGSAKVVRSAKRKTANDQQAVSSTDKIADPLMVALERRTADPPTLARLYQSLLQLSGVESEVVEGLVRGRAPEETFEWAWNIVRIPQKGNTVLQYLVDVALSSFTGPLRYATRVKDATMNAEPSKPSGATESLHKQKHISPAVEEKPKRGVLDGPELASFGAYEKRVETFYFNTHPQEFSPTHFPKKGSHTLLTILPRKVSWECAPRLSHTFFRFPVSLFSHRSRCTFTVRSTPFYITLINRKPEHTELCCLIFEGTLRELPDDCSTALPLGPQWVWHQREEINQRETFTMMVPSAGYYSVIIGAREIRTNPFTAVTSEDPFTPIVAYQVLVTFVPCQVPELPRQHLSPSVCKLLAPLTHELPEGSTRFVVMPSCSNIAAVAVVSRRQSDGFRELISFLLFSLESVAYTGDVTLSSGSEVEVWVLYAAPDHNYVNKTELPSVTSSFQPKQLDAVSGDNRNRDAAQQNTRRGLLFVPFVTHIVVKRHVAASKGMLHIQPLTLIKDEQGPTLRRLIGVTPELYTEVETIAGKKVLPVGSCFSTKSF